MKKRISGAAAAFALIWMMCACSWQQYFVITNNTDDPVSVVYRLASPAGGFGIFETSPSGYGITRKGKIDWNRTLKITDRDTAHDKISIEIPAKSALIIGVLSNDHYKNHDQNFINGREFNLKHLRIVSRSGSREITPDNFDSFFKNEKGFITCKIY